MPVTNPSAIIDAVQADLATLNLNPKKTWSYIEPIIVMPENCPMLAVWCQLTDYTIGSGSQGASYYDRAHHIIVDWIVYSSELANTAGAGDPAIVDALDAVGEQLVERIASYSAGLPGGLGPQMVGTLTQRTVTAREGSIWICSIQFTAQEAS